MCVSAQIHVWPPKTKQNNNEAGQINRTHTVAALCLYTAPCPSGWEVFINKCSRISHWCLSYLPWSCGWHHIFFFFYCSCSYSSFFHNCGPCSTLLHPLLQPTRLLLGSLPCAYFMEKCSFDSFILHFACYKWSITFLIQTFRRRQFSYNTATLLSHILKFR